MVTDASRRALHAALEVHMGREPADTMMELLPPVGWSDVARTSDLTALRGEMAELRAELKGEVAELRVELKSEMAELRGEMSELRGELRGEIAELRGELRSQLPKLYGANMAGAIALAGLVLAATRLG